MLFFLFFQAEDGIRDAQESRGLGDVYKRQGQADVDAGAVGAAGALRGRTVRDPLVPGHARSGHCLLYTSDAADDLLCVDLGGRRIIKKKRNSPLS